MLRQETRTEEPNHDTYPLLEGLEAGQTVATPIFTSHFSQPSAPPIEVDTDDLQPSLNSSVTYLTEAALKKIQAEEQNKLLEHFLNYLRGSDDLSVFKGVITTGGTPDFTEPLKQLDGEHLFALKKILKERMSKTGVFSPRTFLKEASTPATLISTAFFLASPALKIGLTVTGVIYAAYCQYSHQQIIAERANILLAKLPLEIDEPTPDTNPSWLSQLSLFSLFQRGTATTNSAPESHALMQPRQ